jgi:tetratricopeptide (TPR) repeat protein
MRWRQSPNDERRKRDLKNRITALERQLGDASDHHDPMAQAVLHNNLGATYADLKEWDKAFEHYQAAAALVPADASAEERCTPHGNAAAAARRLKQWDHAVAHAVWVDALAGKADDAEQRAVADGALALARKALGKEEFGPVLDAAIAGLPEELRGHVRRDQHADPTFHSSEDQPAAS